MKIQTRTAVLISIVVISLLGVGLLGKFVYYGSLTRSCIYTEEMLPVPENLAQGEIVVSKNAYRASGQEDGYQCLHSIGKIAWELVSPETVNNVTVGAEYYVRQGRSVDEIAVGKRFRVVGVVVVTKHGIGTIDSGGGPINYLILEDAEGSRYSLATVTLGVNKSDEFLDFVSSTGTSPLNVDNFRLPLSKSFVFIESSMSASPGKVSTDNDEALLVKPDYDALRRNCDSDCCIKSLEQMRSSGYPLFQGRCPTGYKQNKLSCIQSFTWCEPESPPVR